MINMQYLNLCSNKNITDEGIKGMTIIMIWQSRIIIITSQICKN